MHTVLCIQQDGIPVIPLKERPVHPQISQMFILDHRPQLLVVSKQDHLEAQIDMTLTSLEPETSQLLSHLQPIAMLTYYTLSTPA